MDTHPAIHHEGAPDREVSGGEGLRGVAFAARVRRRWAAFKTAAKAAESITYIGNLATANPFEMATTRCYLHDLVAHNPVSKGFLAIFKKVQKLGFPNHALPRQKIAFPRQKIVVPRSNHAKPRCIRNFHDSMMPFDFEFMLTIFFHDGHGHRSRTWEHCHSGIVMYDILLATRQKVYLTPSGISTVSHSCLAGFMVHCLFVRRLI